MPVAGNDLGRHRLGRQPHLVGDIGFDARIDVGEGADGAGQRAGRHLFAGGDEPLLGPLELGMGVGELQPEGDRLGVDAVAAADGRRHLVLERAPLEGAQQRVDVGDEEIGGARELHVEARVEHVGGGHALVHEARLGTDDLGEVREEGDDVVLGLALDLVDAGDVELGVAALVPDILGRVMRNDAQLGHGSGCVRLDLEPNAKTGLGVPDGRHLGTAVARDHIFKASREGMRGAVADAAPQLQSSCYARMACALLARSSPWK